MNDKERMSAWDSDQDILGIIYPVVSNFGKPSLGKEIYAISPTFMLLKLSQTGGCAKVLHALYLATA